MLSFNPFQHYFSLQCSQQYVCLQSYQYYFNFQSYQYYFNFQSCQHQFTLQSSQDYFRRQSPENYLSVNHLSIDVGLQSSWHYFSLHSSQFFQSSTCLRLSQPSILAHYFSLNSVFFFINVCILIKSINEFKHNQFVIRVFVIIFTWPCFQFLSVEKHI